jgi:hypothetical protein
LPGGVVRGIRRQGQDDFEQQDWLHRNRILAPGAAGMVDA